MQILALHVRDLSRRSGVGLGSTCVTTTPGYAEAGAHEPHPEKQMFQSSVVVPQLGLIYSHDIHTLWEVLSMNCKSSDDSKGENTVSEGHLDLPPIRAAKILIIKICKHGSPAWFTCGMRSLFFTFIVFWAYLDTLTSSTASYTSWLNDKLAYLWGPPPKFIQPLLSNPLYSFIFNQNRLIPVPPPCQLHGCNVTPSLLLSALLPMASLARGRCHLLCYLLST